MGDAGLVAAGRDGDLLFGNVCGRMIQALKAEVSKASTA